MVFLGVYRAIYDYTPQAEGELAINEGDLLFVLEKDDDWWRAKKRTPNEAEEEPEGLIPNNYIEEAKPAHAARALYDYDRQTDEEVSFAEEDELQVYDTSDEDWTLVGHKGEFGFAPANYIEIQEAAPPTPRRPASQQIQDHTLYEDEQSAEPAPVRRAPSDSSEDDAVRTPAAALAGILAQKTGSGGGASIPSTRRVQFTPEESEEDEPAPSLPRRSTLEASPPPAQIPARPVIRSPEPPSVVASPPDLRIQNTRSADDAPLQSPRGFHIYNIYEMVEAMGRSKKMPVTLGINVAKGVIMISPEQSKDSTEWTAEKMKHYAVEGKHVFMELVRPSKSIDFHAGQKDTAQEIISHLGELAGAARGGGINEVIAAASGADQRIGKMLYDFMAAGDDEVSCAIEDEVLILDDSNDEWWLVKRLKNGKSGVVPSNYVEIVRSATGSKSSSGAPPSRAYIEDNRREEERLAKEAARSKSREAEVGPGLRLPERNSSLFQGDNTRQSSSSRDKKREVSNGKPEAKKALPDKLKCRTWTDRSGTFKVEAEFLGLKDGKIHLHKLNGVKIAVPVTKMSMEDLEYVEWATGVSLDDDKPLSDIKRKNTQRQSDKNKDSSTRPQAGISTSKSDKPEYDWFDFFLSCGINPQICERYSSAFNRDQMGEENMEDITPQLLRTLGFKEGDILRVMKTLDTKFSRSKPVAFDEGGTPTEGTGGLFSGPGGALRNNTRKGRPAPPVESSNTVDPSVFQKDSIAEQSASVPAAKAALASKPKQDLLDGFGDDAWAPRESKSPIASSPPPVQPTVSAPPPTSVQPAVTGAAADLSMLTPALQPTPAPAAASASPVLPSPTVAQPVGVTPSLFDQLAASKANPALQPARQRPIAPQQQFLQSTIAPPPARAASAPQNPQQAFAPPPLQPQLTGYQSQAQPQLQMRTGVVAPGQSMEDQMRNIQIQASQQQFLQQQQQLMPQQTGYQQPGMTSFNTLQAPMMPQQTGYLSQQFPQQQQAFQTFPQQLQPGFMTGQQPNGSPFADSARAPFQPQPTGFQPGIAPGSLIPQPTGYLPPALVPQQTGMPQQQQQPGMFGGNTFNAPPVPPIPQFQSQLQPLVPQKTGPPPPVRFGTAGAKKLAPQPTGKRANLASATPQNPFGF